MKIKYLYFIGLVVFIIAIFNVINCVVAGKSESQITLKGYSRIVLADGSNLEHSSELNELISIIPKAKRFVWSRPDQVLILHSNDSKEIKYLSFFLRDGFVYEGYYLEAWTDRMQGNKSPVYLLNKNEIARAELIFKKN